MNSIDKYRILHLEKGGFTFCLTYLQNKVQIIKDQGIKMEQKF